MVFDILIPAVLVATQSLLVVLCIGFLLSGVDDLFVDALYFWHAARDAVERRSGSRNRPTDRAGARRFAQPSDEQSPAREPALAVIIGAWQEADVIGSMLTSFVTTTQYRRYHIFVGAYPNDRATQAAVQGVAEKHANVHCVVGPHAGPTNKADCLNAVYAHIIASEEALGVRFDAFVMQDAEDVIHPLALATIGASIGEADMVQLPVLPIPGRWHDFTAGHYVDEFCENHGKVLVVRERFAANVTCAGVGCGFSRRALSLCASRNGGKPFFVGSVTEDYELSIRLRRYGMKQVFVSEKARGSGRRLLRADSRRAMNGTTRRCRADESHVGISECFPNVFWQAVRQKSRWVLGIALQGWEHLGWQGDWRLRYMLYRDRKCLVTNFFGVGGYLVVLLLGAITVVQAFVVDAYRFPPLVEDGSWLWYGLIINFYLLLFRLLMRAYFVRRYYDWKEALLSMPRLVWSNFVNFVATFRALKQYAEHRLFGARITWDKTQHVFPTHARAEPQTPTALSALRRVSVASKEREGRVVSA